MKTLNSKTVSLLKSYPSLSHRQLNQVHLALCAYFFLQGRLLDGAAIWRSMVWPELRADLPLVFLELSTLALFGWSVLAAHPAIWLAFCSVALATVAKYDL